MQPRDVCCKTDAYLRKAGTRCCLQVSTKVGEARNMYEKHVDFEYIQARHRHKRDTPSGVIAAKAQFARQIRPSAGLLAVQPRCLPDEVDDRMALLIHDRQSGQSV